MSERFLALPYRAIDAAEGDPAGLLLVMHVYQEAHRRRWGWLRQTVRQLSEQAHCPKHVVEWVMRNLERDGLLEREIVGSGGRKEGTRLRVFDPIRSADMDADTGTDMNADIGVEEEPGEREVSQTPSRTPLRTSTTDLSPEPMSPEFSSELSAGARDGPDEVEVQVAELMALQEADEPQHGMNQPRDRDALRRSLLRGVTADRLRALWACSAVSDDPQIAPCRRGWRRWSGLLKHPMGEARLSISDAWDADGRPAPTATGPPARAAPKTRRFSIRDNPEFQREPA